MSIGLVFLMSLVVVAAFLTLACRVVGWRYVLKHATAIDIVFTVVICLALAGTLTGVLIGILAGLVLTGTLTLAKVLMGAGGAVRERTARRAPKTVTVHPHDDGYTPVGGW